MRILYLDLDTTRSDHLGCYGYHRNTSPTIDRVAADGVVFENCYCSDAPCLPSRTALMSGQFGIHTGVVGHGGTAADRRIVGARRGFKDYHLEQEALPHIFRRQGMRTVLFSPFGERHSSYQFYAGFNEIHNSGKSGMEIADDVSPDVMDWFQRNAATDDWYVHINYWDAHTPYRAPVSFGNPFKNEPAPRWLTADMLSAHREMCGCHKPREIRMFDNSPYAKWPQHLTELKTMEDYKYFIDGYDTGIRYSDLHFSRIVDQLKAAGVYDDTMIVISADHGENQGELGIYGEHATADECTTHIPLIVKYPGGRKGARESSLVYNLDLAPTYAELLGQTKKPGWDGSSFASALTGNDESAGHPYLVIGQCAHTCQRSVRFENWLYIRTWHDGYHLFPDEMLFDIKNDPHETKDLATAMPDVILRARSMYLEWHNQMMKSMPDGYAVDPLRTVMSEDGPLHSRGHLPKYIEYLKKTGRPQHIEPLKAKHPQEFKDLSYTPE